MRLLRSLPERFKVDIKVKEGTHQSENAGASLPQALGPVRRLTAGPLQ